MKTTRASLIVPSIGRTAEVTRLFESLCHQTSMDFHVVLVDQNNDDRLLPLVDQFSGKLPVQHVRSKTRGASRARNAGLPYCRGDILFFPDDDCWYPPDLVENVLLFFDEHPQITGAIGILIDAEGKPHSRWVPDGEKQADLMDAFTRAAEPVLFFRREVVATLGGFDERLGTGAQTPWGAGEGTDLCVRVMRADFRLCVAPSLRVHHDQTVITPGDERQRSKARDYARGMGAVIRKNRLPKGFFFRYFFTYTRALSWSLLIGRWQNVQYHSYRLRGGVEGYRKWNFD